MNKVISGYLMMTLSMICYGVLNPIVKKAGLNPFATIVIQIISLLLVTLPFFLSTASYDKLLINKSGVFLVIIAGVINAVGFYLLIKSFPLFPIWQINLFYILVPLIGAIAAYFLLNEPLSIKLFVGLFVTMLGLFIAFR